MIIINEINNLRLYAASILAPMNSPGRSSSRLSEWRLAPVHHPLVYLPLLLKRLFFVRDLYSPDCDCLHLEV